MRPPQPRSAKAKQRGAALMVMLVIMVMGALTFLVGSLSKPGMQIERDKITANALAQAKDTLIGYAITYGDTHTGQVHGYLPCPDPNGTAGANGEGSSETCGNKNVSVVGRLPWKTLGLPPLRDGNGECLWYAVAGTYKNNPMTDIMNWDTNGLFEILDVNGTALAQDVVAVIFAPGATLNNQNRASDGTAPLCNGNYTATNYLDSDGTLDNGTVSSSANATTQFRLTSSSQINDQLIYITRQDIWDAMLKRNDFMTTLTAMTQKATECIADYGRRNNAGSGDKRLPWAGRFFPDSNDYLTDSNYDDENNRLSGRLPYRVNTSDNDSNNLISGSSLYQLRSDGSNCPNVPTWSTTYYTWWTNWKDHLFYALADDFNPDSGSSSCGTCLSVNGSGSYAAVVMFAGKKLTTQVRSSSNDHLDFANYLEGRNLSNHPNTSGNSDYQSGTETSSFNDVLYCINQGLSVMPC